MKESLRAVMLAMCVLVVIGGVAASVFRVSVDVDGDMLVVAILAVPETEAVIDDHTVRSVRVLRAGEDTAQLGPLCGDSVHALALEAGGTKLLRDAVAVRIDNRPACIELFDSTDMGSLRVEVDDIDRARPSDERPVHTLDIYRRGNVLERLVGSLFGHAVGIALGIVAGWLLAALTDDDTPT